MNLSCSLCCRAPAGRMGGRGSSCFGCQEEAFLCSRSCCSYLSLVLPPPFPVAEISCHSIYLGSIIQFWLLRSVFPNCHRIQWECNLLENGVQFFWLQSVTQTIGSSRFGEVTFRPQDNDCLVFLAIFYKATMGFKFSLKESQNQVFILLKVLNICFLCEICIRRPLTNHEPKPRRDLYWKSFGSEPAAVCMGRTCKPLPSAGSVTTIRHVCTNTDMLQAWVMLGEPHLFCNNRFVERWTVFTRWCCIQVCWQAWPF